jgi:hypothetical protein
MKVSLYRFVHISYFIKRLVDSSYTGNLLHTKLLSMLAVAYSCPFTFFCGALNFTSSPPTSFYFAERRDEDSMFRPVLGLDLSCSLALLFDSFFLAYILYGPLIL